MSETPLRSYNLHFSPKLTTIFPPLFVSSEGALRAPAALPSRVDLRDKFTCPVYDQGNLGSCTANAICALLQLRLKGMMPSPSRRFLYHVELGLDSDLGSDAGSTLESGLQALLKYGICAEATCPYVDNEEIVCQQLPSSAAFVEAAQNKLPAGTVMHVPLQISLFKQALADGLPLAVGIMVYSSFETSVVTETGNIPLPSKSGEQCLGGHAVCLCGYDDAKQSFLLKNSWGPSWALQGYAWLPYSYVSDPVLTSDAVCLASRV